MNCHIHRTVVIRSPKHFFFLVSPTEAKKRFINIFFLASPTEAKKRFIVKRRKEKPTQLSYNWD